MLRLSTSAFESVDEALLTIEPATDGGPVAASFDWLRGLARALRREDLHRLDVHHLEEPIATQLAADAAVLDAAEGHPWIQFHDAVYEHHSRVDLPHEALGPLEVPGPQACAQSELGIVRFAHRGVEVSHREDRCDGTERLFLQHPHRPRHPTEYGGLVEPTGTGDSFSTDFDAGPFADRILHLTLDLLPLGLVDQRSNVRRGTKGIPDTEGSDLLHEPRGELLGDRVHHDEPLCGDALAGLTTAVLPAMSAGTAKRTICHIGKFHGMMEPRTPRGSNAMYAFIASVSTGSGSRNRGPSFAKTSAAHAHFSTSAFASRMTLPISNVIVRAYSSRCFRRISARCER